MSEWHPSASGVVAPNAVVGGNDVNGEAIFIGRAYESGTTIPGKIVPSHGLCYVSYAGSEKSHKTYEYLVQPKNGTLAWVSASNGAVPTGAVQGGRNWDGETLYVGRAYYSGSLVPGKVHPSHRVLYLPFACKEVAISNYEVLCHQN